MGAIRLAALATLCLRPLRVRRTVAVSRRRFGGSLTTHICLVDLYMYMYP